MRRNENIILLSRDHHFGLLCSWKIRQGFKKNIPYERMREYILFFWNENLKSHFEEEEKYLFGYLDDSYTRQALEEHQEIKLMVEAIKESNDILLLENFADLLEEHIRFEERVLFPYLEENLDAQQLGEVGKNLREHHEASQDEYFDEFWK